jgi:drug/metabolite transporter (DMT)-like permease
VTRIIFGLMFALFGALLIVAAKQVNRDSKAAPPLGYSNLTGRLSPLGSQVAGVCCLVAALLWWFA